MYIKMTKDGDKATVTIHRRKKRSPIELEAFGPYDLLPREIYSKHNLEVKYGTKGAKTIVKERLKIAASYGYDSESYELTAEDKENILTIDYLDALFGTQRVRVLYGMQNEKYMGVLNSEWTWDNLLANEWASRSAPRMLDNFMRTQNIAKLWLGNLEQSRAPVFIRLWASDLLVQIDRDLDFYQRLKADLDKTIAEKIAKL